MITIALYMALLRVMPSHYRAVSVVHMRRKGLDKRQTVSMHVMQDGVMIPKFHKVSVHSFLIERMCLWKAVCSGDVFIWGFWHTSVITDVL